MDLRKVYVTLCHITSQLSGPHQTHQKVWSTQKSKHADDDLLLKAWERAKQKGGEFHQRAKNQYCTRAMFLNVDPSILYAHSGKSRCIRHSYLQNSMCNDAKCSQRTSEDRSGFFKILSCTYFYRENPLAQDFLYNSILYNLFPRVVLEIYGELFLIYFRKYN